MGRASAALLLLGPKPGAEQISPPPNLGALLIGQSGRVMTVCLDVIEASTALSDMRTRMP
jgi:hypothetical protein